MQGLRGASEAPQCAPEEHRRKKFPMKAFWPLSRLCCLLSVVSYALLTSPEITEASTTEASTAVSEAPNALPGIQSVPAGEYFLAPRGSDEVTAAPSRRGGGTSKPYAIVDCTENDLEAMRQLLLVTPEYPVTYKRSTMRYFAGLPRFFEMCVVAKEAMAAPQSDADTEADTDSEDGFRTLGRVVGLVAAAEMPRGTADILMVAVHKDFRRMGLGKRMMHAVLEKASRFAKKNNDGGSVLQDASLHVWISQIAPLSLYMSLGFGPTKYYPTYYSEQEVTAGFEMHLPLPYERIEDTYKEKIRIKEARLRELQLSLAEAGAARRFHGTADREGFIPTAFVNPTAMESHTVTALLSFLEKAAPKKLGVSQTMEQIMRSAPELSFVAVEPDGQVSGAIWVGASTASGVIQDIKVLVNGTEDGFIYLSLFDKLLTEASRMKEFHSVQHKIYCDEVESLIYMWKLGMYPIDFAPVPGREFMRHPTYQYTTETKLPWTRGEELALTLRNRLLDREIAHEEQRQRLLMTMPPVAPRAPIPPAVAPPAATSVPAVVPQAENQEAPDGEIEQRKPVPSDATAPSPPASAPPAAPSAPEVAPQAAPRPSSVGETESVKISGVESMGAVQAVKSKEAGSSPAEEARKNQELIPWYKTVTGVLGMIVCCSILFFLCFRCCSQREVGTPPSATQRGSAVAPVDSTHTGKKGDCQRRPTGRKEGYSHISDDQNVHEPQSETWWSHEDVEAFNSA